jgi:hypothetical protein
MVTVVKFVSVGVVVVVDGFVVVVDGLDVVEPPPPPPPQAANRTIDPIAPIAPNRLIMNNPLTTRDAP